MPVLTELLEMPTVPWAFSKEIQKQNAYNPTQENILQIEKIQAKLQDGPPVIMTLDPVSLQCWKNLDCRTLEQRWADTHSSLFYGIAQMGRCPSKSLLWHCTWACGNSYARVHPGRNQLRLNTRVVPIKILLRTIIVQKRTLIHTTGM